MEDRMFEVVDRFTDVDIELASVYYNILVERCKSGNVSDISYGELVNIAKEKHIGNAIVANAIPVSTGRRLGVIRFFTSKKGLADLTCLVVTENKRINGKAYLKEFDPILEHKKVFEYDWSSVTSDFSQFVNEARAINTRKKKRTWNNSAEIVYKFYKNNENLLIPNIAEYRDEIIEMLMDGFTVEKAFADFFIIKE